MKALIGPNDPYLGAPEIKPAKQTLGGSFEMESVSGLVSFKSHPNQKETQAGK